MKIHDHLPLLETILNERADIIGPQFAAYKNHVYHVLNFYLGFHYCQNDDLEKLLIAGCFHDLGIWLNHVVDYLAPSIALAQVRSLEYGHAGGFAYSIGRGSLFLGKSRILTLKCMGISIAA